MLTALLLHAAGLAPAEFALGPKGEILAWVVQGPVTPDAPNEPVAAAAEANGFRLAVADPMRGLDLNAALGYQEGKWGYAATVLHADAERRVPLLFGTDDGFAVFLNGTKLAERRVTRGIKRDEETVELPLRAGPNVLAFRIEQVNRGWGLLARLPDPQGIRNGLEIAATGPEPLARLSRGQSGALDLPTVRRYEQIRDRATLWLERFRNEARDPERLRRALENAKTLPTSDGGVVSGRLLQDADAIQVAYQYAREPMLLAAQKPKPLVNVDPKRENWVTVAPGGRYFVDGRGRTFTPIGYNHNPDWPPFEEANPMRPGPYNPRAVDRWFAKLAEHRVNLVRLMVETPPSGNLEEPVGTFQPEHMRWLDTVVLAARRHGVRLKVTPYDTFWMNLRRETSPYFPERGGPVTENIRWYTDERLRDAQVRRMKWLIDRYGNLDTIFCWDLMNEADIWWGASPAQLQEWADRYVTEVRNYQMERWGRSPLVTISMAEPIPGGELAEFAFRRPDFDFATTHLYLGAAKAPKRPTDVVAPMVQGVHHAYSQIRDARPYLDSENGPIDDWIESVAQDDLTFHDQTWAHLAAGGAGSGLRWPYRGPHHLTDGMLDHLNRVARFCDAVNWKKLGPTQKPLEWKAPAGWEGAGSTGLLFAVRADATGPTRLELPPTFARARVYDTMKGVWLGKATGTTFTIPADVRAVAFALEQR